MRKRGSLPLVLVSFMDSIPHSLLHPHNALIHHSHPRETRAPAASMRAFQRRGKDCGKMFTDGSDGSASVVPPKDVDRQI